VGGSRLAEVLRNECNELLLSNGKEIDLASLLESPDTTEEQDDGMPPMPPISRSKSHLKRPTGLALHDLQVPAQPAAIPFATGTAPPPNGEAAGSSAADGGQIAEVDELPLGDVVSALSPLLASSLGIAPQSMRSFLRIDDLTFDLLSPLGEARAAAEEGKF